MKKKIKGWTFKLLVTGTFLIIILICIVLNPILLYANKTHCLNYTIYSGRKEAAPDLKKELAQVSLLIANSEFYTKELKIDICLNDGSLYPQIINKLCGPAFGYGFANKVVLLGNANYEMNYVELNGYKWNMTELIAHETVHCLQFARLGLFKSNPVARYPHWKWEGYPEYIARLQNSQRSLKRNIARMLQTEKASNDGWIQFEDGTGTVIPYYKNWLLMQYCMDIKHMSYQQVLQDTCSEKTVQNEMMKWYND